MLNVILFTASTGYVGLVDLIHLKLIVIDKIYYFINSLSYDNSYLKKPYPSPKSIPSISLSIL